jgi:hypothetical protein
MSLYQRIPKESIPKIQEQAKVARLITDSRLLNKIQPLEKKI